MAYREYYRNADGEPLGWGTVYDDEPEYGSLWGDDESRYFGGDYPMKCRYCGDHCDGDCEPVRCEADIYADGIAQTEVVACQWRIPLGKNCPNESSHLRADGLHYGDGIPF